MAQIIHFVAAWWTGHPSTQAFVYFLICLFVALYTDFSRRILMLPLNATSKWANVQANKSLKNRLAIIKWVHNDPYALILYLAYAIVDGFIDSVILSIFVNAYTIITGLLMHSPITWQLNGYSAFFGGVIGQAYKLRGTLKALHDYDASVKSLSEATADTPAN